MVILISWRPRFFCRARMFPPGIMKCAANVWRRTWISWPRRSTMEVFSITDKNWKYQSVKNLRPSQATISSYNSLLIGMLLFFLPLVLTNVIRYFVTWERVRLTASRQRAPVLKQILTTKASRMLWRWQTYSSSVICSSVSQAISFFGNGELAHVL